MAKKKEAKIIVIAHHKGGVGKSMIAINLAHALINMKYSVALVDIDSQGTSKKLANNIDIYGINDDIEKNKYNIILIDTPPYLTKDTYNTYLSADFVIMPARPNPSDVDTLPATIDLFKRAKIKNPKLKGAILINQNIGASSIWGEIKPIFDELDIPILNTMLEMRVSYARSIIDDNGIFTQDDKKAQQEITQLAIELIKIINI